jgi:hypothetical protein
METYEEGLEEYPKGSVVFANIMMILWISSGSIACWFFILC